MKKIIFSFVFVFIISKVSAQCDNPYYRLKEGTLIVMESFDKKDNLETRSETKVVKYADVANGFEATIAAKLLDKKEKLISEGEYDIRCENGVIKIDMSGLVPAESLKAFKDMEVDVTMDQLEYPSKMQPGQVLNDASIKISASSGPMPMNLVMDITNRKVEDKTTITTPAGTFDCYKISYNMHSKMMMVNMNFTSVEYLSENCGAVKTETYKNNGKLMGYTLLTKYEY